MTLVFDDSVQIEIVASPDDLDLLSEEIVAIQYSEWLDGRPDYSIKEKPA